MKITLIVTGRTEETWLRTGIREYESRIGHYVPFSIHEIPALKNAANLTQLQQQQREAELIQNQLLPGDTMVLLDERGTTFRSVEFADFLNKQFVAGGKNLVFVAGGPFGFDPELRKKARFLLSLSKMTFSHQMVRLFFTEQLYRALTILRGPSYHHE